jgi:hypothetical protein
MKTVVGRVLIIIGCALAFIGELLVATSEPRA